MSELGQTNDPKVLVPGDAAAIFENVRVLRGRYDDVSAAGEALKRIDTGGWTGQAADSFHEQHDTDVPRWFSAADSLDNGASALEDYADCLVWAQGQAAGAIDLWRQGEAATLQAKEAHDRAVADAQAQTQANAARGDPTVVQPPPFVDAGEPKRQAARDMLNPARRQLADVADRTAEALLAEAELAPLDSLKQSDADFFGGIWDTISGFGQGLVGLITDPLGTAEAIAYNVTHPVETFKDAVAWDDWANGQGDRALGKIVGGLLLGGGAGKLAKSLLRRRGDNGSDSKGDRETISDPKKFDPGTLKGETPDQVRAGIPSDWTRSGSKTGGGEVFRDPNNPGRQIRIMPGYPEGSRPDPLTTGPYAVVSQNGVTVKIPLAGNPTLR
ncbi:MAG: WXG100 family type VII secretion target [Pseudonocardiaceae bacterium]